VSYTLPPFCPETDWNIRVGKQGYVFFKRCDDLMFHSRHQSVSGITLKLREVEFFK